MIGTQQSKYNSEFSKIANTKYLSSKRNYLVPCSYRRKIFMIISLHIITYAYN